MKLIRNAPIAIVLPNNATTREQFAAAELEKYLKKILNVNIDASNASIRFIIGGPGRNEAAKELVSSEEFSLLLTGEEGMLIRIQGNTVLIAGSEGFEDRERGTVYGVYEFLERYLGCSLAIYSEPTADVGEFVPILEELVLEDTQYVKAGSDRPYRCAIVQYGDSAGNPDHGLNISFLDWMAKNRYNRMLVWCSIYEGWKKLGLIPEIEKRGIRLSVGHHDAVNQWLPFYGNEYFPEKYSETHPEYYRLNSDGTRFQPVKPEDPWGQWVFCSRNQDCIEQLSKNLIQWITDNPVVDIVALWPMDGKYEQCCCPDCAPYHKIENYAYFLNEVAKRVAKVHPLMKMDMLLYTNLWEHPENLKLSKSLFCDMSTWAYTGLRTCGKPDGSGLVDSYYTDTLLKWKENGSEVAFYDYYMSVYSARQRLIPIADEIQAIWKYFKEQGILGAGTQIEVFHLWNHLVNFYCFGRSGYDNTLSLEDNLSRLAPLFGEGAPYISQIIMIMEDIIDGQVTLGKAPNFLMQHLDCDIVYDLFEKALACTTNSRTRNNIRMMRMAFRYSNLEYHDPGHDQKFAPLLEYEDKTGELAYMATEFDSFTHNYTGYGIAFPLSNKDTKDFKPDKWYIFD